MENNQNLNWIRTSAREYQPMSSEEIQRLEIKYAINKAWLMKEQERKDLEAKFKSIFPNGSKEQLETFIRVNTEKEELIPNTCRIDDPDCLSCGS